MSRIEDLISDHSKDAMDNAYGDRDYQELYADFVDLLHHAARQRSHLAVLNASVRGLRKEISLWRDPERLPDALARVHGDLRQQMRQNRMTVAWKDYFLEKWRWALRLLDEEGVDVPDGLRWVNERDVKPRFEEIIPPHGDGPDAGGDDGRRT